MYNLPSIIPRKLAYVNNLALLHSSGNWKDLEGTLSQDMSTLSAYFQTCRLKLSHTKTVTAAFYLSNREAKREVKAYNNDRLLPFRLTPYKPSVVRNDFFGDRPMEQAQAHRRGDVIIPLTVPNPRLHEPRSKPYLSNVSNQFSFKLINSKIKLISSKRKK